MNNRGICYSSGTDVFWLVEEIPTPSDPNGHLISCNIRLALEKMGYYGWQSFLAYGPEKISTEAEWCDPGILYVSEGDKDARVHMMLFDLIAYASNFRDDKKRTNLMVISKNPPKDEFLRVLCAFESRGFNVLLVQPHDEADLIRSADSKICFTTSLDGLSPHMDFDNFDSFSISSWETDSDPDPGNRTDPENLNSSSLTS